MIVNGSDVKPFLAEMLEKYGLNTEMWKRDMNNLPDEQRQMVFSFDTDVKDEKAVFKFKFIVTDVELELTPGLKEKIIDMIESGSMDL